MAVIGTYNRPGFARYVTRLNSDPALKHGGVVLKSGFVGIAVKQKPESWKTGFSGLNVIADNEPYLILVKGIVQVPVTGITAPAPGDKVYITAANALTKTAGTDQAFGRIVEIAGQRGCPTGFVRIDLDAKDTINTP